MGGMITHASHDFYGGSIRESSTIKYAVLRSGELWVASGSAGYTSGGAGLPSAL